MDIKSRATLDVEVVDLCCNFLRNYMEIEGLFRISGETTAVKELYDSFCNPQEVTFPPKTSPHSVGSAFKQWLRSLQPPIFPPSFFGAALEAVDAKNTMALSHLIHKLPSLHYLILEKLVFFLVQFAEKSSINKMDLKNISIIFGPSLLPVEPEDNPIAVVQTQLKTTKIIEYILQNSKLLFNNKVFFYPMNLQFIG